MKKWISVLIIFILAFICFEILTERESILNSVNFSVSIWKDNIFPSLFPFFVLSEVMVKYGIPEFLGNLLKGVMNRLFRIKGIASFVFVMSIISGNPANAKYTRELYLSGDLNEHEASKILCFSCFANPLFILGTVSLMFLDNKKVGLLILLCHYLGNIIIGLLIRNFYPSKLESEHFSLALAIDEMHSKRINNTQSFGTIITSSIINSINTLLLILGVMSMFLVITTIIDNNISINSVLQSILNGFIEMTQGLKYISLEDIPLKLKCILSVMILSFGGFSVHMQIIGILSDTNIKYLPFLICRILHAVISGVLMFLFFDIWFC